MKQNVTVAVGFTSVFNVDSIYKILCSNDRRQHQVQHHN